MSPDGADGSGDADDPSFADAVFEQSTLLNVPTPGSTPGVGPASKPVGGGKLAFIARSTSLDNTVAGPPLLVDSEAIAAIGAAQHETDDHAIVVAQAAPQVTVPGAVPEPSGGGPKGPNGNKSSLKVIQGGGGLGKPKPPKLGPRNLAGPVAFVTAVEFGRYVLDEFIPPQVDVQVDDHNRIIADWRVGGTLVVASLENGVPSEQRGYPRLERRKDFYGFEARTSDGVLIATKGIADAHWTLKIDELPESLAEQLRTAPALTDEELSTLAPLRIPLQPGEQLVRFGDWIYVRDANGGIRPVTRVGDPTSTTDPYAPYMSSVGSTSGSPGGSPGGRPEYELSDDARRQLAELRIPVHMVQDVIDFSGQQFLDRKNGRIGYAAQMRGGNTLWVGTDQRTRSVTDIEIHSDFPFLTGNDRFVVHGPRLNHHSMTRMEGRAIPREVVHKVIDYGQLYINREHGTYNHVLRQPDGKTIIVATDRENGDVVTVVERDAGSFDPNVTHVDGRPRYDLQGNRTSAKATEDMIRQGITRADAQNIIDNGQPYDDRRFNNVVYATSTSKGPTLAVSISRDDGTIVTVWKAPADFNWNVRYAGSPRFVPRGNRFSKGAQNDLARLDVHRRRAQEVVDSGTQYFDRRYNNHVSVSQEPDGTFLWVATDRNNGTVIAVRLESGNFDWDAALPDGWARLMPRDD